ncbi:MAG: hypothetical protein JXB32_23160 [Deltaproteobacteria bacterium]|nr:hypothetical protein [Deltaproteobacteria bacterium]
MAQTRRTTMRTTWIPGVLLLLAGCDGGNVGLTGEVSGECSSDRQCDDGDPCNGAEECVDGACRPGTPTDEPLPCSLPDGSAGTCRGGICGPTACGNGVIDPGEECDDGNTVLGDGCDLLCLTDCHADDECDDGDPCTADACAPTGGGRTCTSTPVPDGTACDDGNPCSTGDCCTGGLCEGAPVACDDGDPCTTDRCDAAAGGCVFVPHPRWYPDADGDGWGSGTDDVCAATAPPGTAARTGDCCDANPDVHPEQPTYFATPYFCSTGEPPSFDYDCSGTVELEHPDLADFCPTGRDASGYCYRIAAGWCPAEAGGDCGFVPDCGSLGIYQSSCSPEFDWLACDDVVEPPPLDAGTPTADAGTPTPDVGTGTGTDEADGRSKESVAIYCCRPTFELRVQACR